MTMQLNGCMYIVNNVFGEIIFVQEPDGEYWLCEYQRGAKKGWSFTNCCSFSHGVIVHVHANACSYVPEFRHL